MQTAAGKMQTVDLQTSPADRQMVRFNVRVYAYG